MVLLPRHSSQNDKRQTARSNYTNDYMYMHICITETIIVRV